jgi:hypothetical protein
MRVKARTLRPWNIQGREGVSIFGGVHHPSSPVPTASPLFSGAIGAGSPEYTVRFHF